jgi:hypothetical protein
MTADGFRKLALSMADAVEVGHMRHPDFRVAGRIFATLGSPDETFAMVVLTPEEQAVLLAAEPAAFTPAAGAWGRRGSTLVRLSETRTDIARRALAMAHATALAKPRVRSRSRKAKASPQP